jgi:hypothetical protein
MIYKLKYLDRETAIADLIAKGVLVESTDLNNNTTIVNTSITQAVVELGIIVLTSGTYDEDFNEITAPIYADGYHYDVMSENKIDFGSNEIQVKTPKHIFAS